MKFNKFTLKDCNPGTRSIQQRTPFHRTAFVIYLLLTSCIVPSDDDSKQRSFSLVVSNSEDSIPPFGTIAVVCSEPIPETTSVEFIFSPPSHGHYVTANDTRDTFFITLGDPLPGNTRYILTAATGTFTADDVYLHYATDTITLFTYSREHEPNQSPATADSLSGKRYGTITTSNDTDFYHLPSTASAVYLHSFGSATALSITDGAHTVHCSTYDSSCDTITIPDTLISPISAFACSWKKSTGGYYEIGSINE